MTASIMLHLVWYNQCGFASHCSVEALSEVGLIVSMKFDGIAAKIFIVPLIAVWGMQHLKLYSRGDS